MAWDENVCANSPAPEFDIPEDKSALEQFLDAMGLQTYPIVTQDENGNEIHITVIGLKTQSSAKVCEAKVCEATVGCGNGEDGNGEELGHK